MDLLGSILDTMEKPPGMADEEKKKVKAQKAKLEKIQQAEKQKMKAFKEKIQARINAFIKDDTKQNYKFESMEKVYRATVHEIADVAGLTSFSFGQDELDRYVMLWKKEFAPSDEEILAYRNGEEWDPEKAKQAKVLEEQYKLEEAKRKPDTSKPQTNYKDKYEHLIGKASAKDAAKITLANKSYGFVPSENKRDQRTIEQVMADSRAKKKLKTDHLENQDIDSEHTTKSSQS
ncbi:sperm-associated antigen 7 homolog isoform X2 [Lingula anatina]|uniref:Sperm-associated antigen 7 homolog isoform X2 n=1 Tax=Lingula anatina TaxID=7574 RepID=A0A1S3JTK8_LINAN|nr:sperm-associated antigen 7 homolog isoform X2 [Lingula anatina]|eukprot:XP_013413441.1 sperm-associated antigen 7 homolog isoform X2 [Lingula anatina]